MIPEGTYQFLGIQDGFAIVLWFFILLFLVNSKASKNSALSHYTYYRLGFFVKLFAAIFFSLIYIYKYGGGDTTAYWDTAQKLNNLLFENPSGFFFEFFNSYDNRVRWGNFNTAIGMPPEWIYNENEGWFTAKVMFFLSLITFKSYFAMTMICAYISFKASWLLFEMALKYNVGTIRNIAIATLFLPSTAFWCTGISKDMIVYSCVIFALHFLFQLIQKGTKLGFVYFVKLFIIYYLLVNIRDFMLIAALGPFLFSYGIKLSNKQKSTFSKLAIRFSILLLLLLGLSVFFSSSKAQEFSSEAQSIQSDLKNNTEYGGARYDLGISDFSPLGMLKAMPISIYTAFYRPYFWEAGSLFILISALETFLFLILTITLVFRTGVVLIFKRIQENEFLIMAMVFSLILGFFAGYTSGLFGVLVRFKAPLLPFLFIVLTMTIKNTDKDQFELRQ